jgi:hypothetical protein
MYEKKMHFIFEYQVVKYTEVLLEVNELVSFYRLKLQLMVMAMTTHV